MSEQHSAESGALGRGAGGDAPGPYEDAPADRIQAQRDLENWLTDNRWPNAYDLSHALADAGFTRVTPPERCRACREGVPAEIAPCLCPIPPDSMPDPH